MMCHRRFADLGRTVVLPLAVVLAACAPSRPLPSGNASHSAAVEILQRVNSQAHQCWLKDDQFSAYGIVPELDTAGTPRLLVIPRGKPQSLPQLVIAANGSEVSIYGPLGSSALAPRIRADVSRWSGGGGGCA
jgi:hypothetical protein